jgi:Flp pilus assembly CpaE family ATPase
VTPLSVPPSDVLLLVEGLRQLADIVVLDVPCTYDAMYFETLMAADQVVLVAEQKVPSIRSLQMIHGQLQDKLHHLVLNRYDPNVPGFGVDRLRTMLGVSEILTIVSDYPSVVSAVNQGLPLKLKEPKSKVLTGITALAQKLLPRPTEMEETKKPSSMFGRLISTLGIKK